MGEILGDLIVVNGIQFSVGITKILLGTSTINDKWAIVMVNSDG